MATRKWPDSGVHSGQVFQRKTQPHFAVSWLITFQMNWYQLLMFDIQFMTFHITLMKLYC